MAFPSTTVRYEQLQPIADSQICALEEKDDETDVSMYCYSPIKCLSPIITPVSPLSSPSVDIILPGTPPPSPSVDLPDITSEPQQTALSSTDLFLLDNGGYDDHGDEDFNDNDGATYHDNDEYASFTCDTEQLMRIELARGRGNPSTDDIFYEALAELPLLAADDTCVEAEPATRVDYFLHEWKEEDLWASWQYVVYHRYAESENKRLENAAWRTWAKCKLNLGVVSPESINWLKDDDSTWLYGPLKKYDLSERTSGKASPFSPQNSAENGGLGKNLKPILKRKSASETILEGCMFLSVPLQYEDTITAVDDALRPEETRLASWDQYIGSMVHSIHLPASTTTTSRPSSLRERHHVRFNREVRQCIILDEEEGDDYDMMPMPVDDDVSSDDDGLFIIELPGTTPDPPSRLAHVNPVKEYKTIALLPSTTINFHSDRSRTLSRLMSSYWLDQSSLSTVSSTPPIDIPRPLSLLPELPLNTDDLFPLSDDDDHNDPKSWWTYTNINPFGEVSRDFETEHDLIVADLAEPYQNCDLSGGKTMGRVMDTVTRMTNFAHVLWHAG